MGLLGGLMGHASEIDAAKVQAEFERVLAPGERVERAYQLIRDQFVFTDKRLILVDRQGNDELEGGVPLAAVSSDHAFQRRDRGHVRHGRRVEGLDLRLSGAGAEDVQQEAQHL